VRQGRTRNCCSVKAIVTVMPKRSVLDPQGAATAEAMKHLGLDKVARVRVGKSIEIELQSAVDETKLHQIARDLLSNPIIEDYRLEVEP
jgi:phosphoribosylformylglycinamidine synthase PurS subunit